MTLEEELEFLRKENERLKNRLHHPARHNLSGWFSRMSLGVCRQLAKEHPESINPNYIGSMHKRLRSELNKLIPLIMEVHDPDIIDETMKSFYRTERLNRRTCKRARRALRIKERNDS